MDRRRFVRSTLLGLGGAPVVGRFASAFAARSSLFKLGVASGDVSATGVVLWTRLAPEPGVADGGMPAEEVSVRWELSTDPAFTNISRSGMEQATPTLAHSVHVELDDLSPASEYWYRFSANGQYSPVGRTKTLPLDLQKTDSIRFATASCQNFSHGHFGAYRHVVRDSPDFVMHLGDYIYETSFGENVRPHPSDEPPRTLDEFRLWHTHYKSDPDLQLAHATLPFFAVLDNHDAVPDGDNAQRELRRAAYQAWYEHMPVRGYSRPGSDRFSMHRCINLGDVAQICLLDSRQYRDSIELCSQDYDRSYGFGNYRQRCSAVFSESRSMLGQAQTSWLIENIKKAPAAWNVVASPGPFQPFSYRVEGEDRRYISAWDAYPANRSRIANALLQSSASRPLVVSGDVHSFWAVDGAKTPWKGERFPIMEFTTSSISANWPPALAEPVTQNLEHNPQVQYYEPAYRGYMLHDVSADQWQTTARAVSTVLNRDSQVSSIARFVVDRDYRLSMKSR